MITALFILSRIIVIRAICKVIGYFKKATVYPDDFMDTTNKNLYTDEKTSKQQNENK